MAGILDRLAQRHANNFKRQYRPASSDDFFALRLAAHLRDTEAVEHYVELCERFPRAVVIEAYRMAQRAGENEPVRVFHAVLGQGTAGEEPVAADCAGIRVERRAVAVAIFHGTRLKYPPIVHQLSSDASKVLGSAATFIARLQEKCAFTSAALEAGASDQLQRGQIQNMVIKVLVDQQVSVHQFPKTAVLASFGQPPLRFRKQVRDGVSSIWPEVNGGFGAPLLRDALALGLFAQTERLFAAS